MRKYIHRLTNLDREARTAHCKNCGDVRVKRSGKPRKDGELSYRCAEAIKLERKNNPNRKTIKVNSKEYFSSRIYNLKRSALNRKKDFTITDNELVRLYKEELCYFCNELAPVRTIDRLDNSLGYTSSNCVLGV